MPDAFALWTRDCERTEMELWPMEGRGDHGVYMTKKAYWSRNYRFFTTPMYHVWIRGKCVLTTSNYREAVSRWETDESNAQ